MYEINTLPNENVTKFTKFEKVIIKQTMPVMQILKPLIQAKSYLISLVCLI